MEAVRTMGGRPVAACGGAHLLSDAQCAPPQRRYPSCLDLALSAQRLVDPREPVYGLFVVSSAFGKTFFAAWREFRVRTQNPHLAVRTPRVGATGSGCSFQTGYALTRNKPLHEEALFPET